MRIASVDSPNGRHGDEPVELFAAADGVHEIAVRTLDRSEPAGAYEIKLMQRSDAAATRQLLEGRARARADATAWLRSHAGAARLTAAGIEGPSLERFDALARRSHVPAWAKPPTAAASSATRGWR